jgi:hypothetical protein
MTEECQCGGAGFQNLTTQDLIMLNNIMKGQNNDVAKGTRIAIRKELFKRGVQNV